MPSLCSSRLHWCRPTPLQSWKRTGRCLGGRAGRGHIDPPSLQWECEGVMGGSGRRWREHASVGGYVQDSGEEEIRSKY